MSHMRLGHTWRISAYKPRSERNTHDSISFEVLEHTEECGKQIYNLLDDTLPPEWELKLEHNDVSCTFEFLAARGNTKPAFKEQGELPARA